MKKLTVIIPTYNQKDAIEIGLRSIPEDPRIETIVVDDGSTDGTSETVKKHIKNNPKKDIKLFILSKNCGISFALNKGLDEASGEYVVLLGSDGDYFIPTTIELALNSWLDGTDLVYFNVVDNTGHIRVLSERTINKYVGSVKFMRRAFIGQIRNPLNRRRAEDVVFNQELLRKHPTMKFTNRVVKHYNYPREGSLTWNARHGITDSVGNEL